MLQNGLLMGLQVFKLDDNRGVVSIAYWQGSSVLAGGLGFDRGSGLLSHRLQILGQILGHIMSGDRLARRKAFRQKID